MNIQQAFCPRCGAPSPEGGLCPKCRVAETTWLSCEPRVTAVSCPTCESLKRGGTWSDLQTERSELVAELALQAVGLHPDVRDAAVEVRCEDTRPNRTSCIVDVDAMLYAVPVHGTCTVEIVWRREQCDRCSRISGSYYEGIVQVRATGRKINAHEREAAAAIAEQVEDALQQAGERLSFVSSIEESRDGLDIVVGSRHLGQMISQQITGALGGRYTTHPRLVGERDGKALYRITYSVRLPYYRKGDVVVSRGMYYEIRVIEPRRLAVFDLQTGAARLMHETEIERRVGNVCEAESAIVAFVHGNTVGLLDPKTYQTREVSALPWLTPAEGMPVRVIRDEEQDRLIMVG